MSLRKIKEYWVKNVTQSDLIISDLSLKIKSEQIANLFQLNPKLTKLQLMESEEDGAIGKCLALRKILKLPCAPLITEQDLPTEILEATKSIPSRVKSSNIMDIKELDFIEELSDFPSDDSGQIYENFDEGFSDPMIEAIPINEDGSETAIIVNPAQDKGTIEISAHDTKMGPQQVGTGHSRYITVRTIK